MDIVGAYQQQTEYAMSGTHQSALISLIGRIPFFGPTPGRKIRFIAGAGINVIGAAVVLFEVLQSAGLPV